MIGFAREEMSRGLCLRRKFSVERVGHPDWIGPARAFAEELAGMVRPGQVVLVKGASGSGKSLLMGQLQRALATRACIVGNAELPDVPVIDALHFLELEDALSILCRFGLGEVSSYLAPVRLLSTGQQFRLRLAMGYARIHRRAHHRAAPTATDRPAPHVLLVDEFATSLDEVGAAIIARNFSRVIHHADSAASGVGAIVATCRGDLGKAIRPDRVVKCDFGAYALRWASCDSARG